MTARERAEKCFALAWLAMTQPDRPTGETIADIERIIRDAEICAVRERTNCKCRKN